MDELKTLFEDFLQKAEVAFAAQMDILEKKRQELLLSKKNVVELNQKAEELAVREKTLNEWELSLKATQERSRQKAEVLDLREKKLEDEKARLQHLMDSI